MTNVIKTSISSVMRRSEQAPLGTYAHACLPVVGWLNQIPAFDTEKPLG